MKMCNGLITGVAFNRISPLFIQMNKGDIFMPLCKMWHWVKIAYIACL